MKKDMTRNGGKTHEPDGVFCSTHDMREISELHSTFIHVPKKFYGARKIRISNNKGNKIVCKGLCSGKGNSQLFNI